jgi:ferric iron reductase protein FhuF
VNVLLASQDHIVKQTLTNVHQSHAQTVECVSTKYKVMIVIVLMASLVLNVKQIQTSVVAIRVAMAEHVKMT